MERIETVKAPMVGTEYLVPTIDVRSDSEAELTDSGLASESKTPIVNFVPVIGNWHNDAVFQFGAQNHTHYDFRFLQSIVFDALLESGLERSAYEEYMRISPNKKSNVVLFPLFQKQKKPVKHRKMKMLRKPVLPDIRLTGFMMETLQKHYKKHVIDVNNPVCPHRKASLNGAAEENGCLVCPCHGLRWDKKTGALCEVKLPDYCKDT